MFCYICLFAIFLTVSKSKPIMKGGYGHIDTFCWPNMLRHLRPFILQIDSCMYTVNNLRKSNKNNQFPIYSFFRWLGH
jgi:hypothetical protein